VIRAPGLAADDYRGRTCGLRGRTPEDSEQSFRSVHQTIFPQASEGVVVASLSRNAHQRWLASHQCRARFCRNRGDSQAGIVASSCAKVVAASASTRMLTPTQIKFLGRAACWTMIQQAQAIDGNALALLRNSYVFPQISAARQRRRCALLCRWTDPTLLASCS
jgi:hypothetical protein